MIEMWFFSLYVWHGWLILCSSLWISSCHNFVQESSDSSVVTCWTVNQEVVGSNQTYGRNSNFCCALTLQVYSAHPVKWVVASTQLGLKIRVYFLRWLAVVSDCTCTRVENDTLHKQYTHGHRICPSRHNTHLWLHGYVCHVGNAARSSKITCDYLG